MTDSYIKPDADALKARPLDEVFDTMMEVEKNPYGAWEAIQTQADRIEQLESTLTQSQDLVDRWINTSAEQHQTIVEMREALTQSQAEVAAAYERAADAAEDYPRVAPDYDEWTRYDEQIAHSQKCIRALSTTDQTAALDTIRAEAREQGMREAAAVCSGMADNAFTELAREHAVQCSEAILEAITKGDKA